MNIEQPQPVKPFPGKSRRRRRKGRQSRVKTLLVAAQSLLDTSAIPAGTATVMALFAACMTFGGGGTTNPETEMILQLLIAAVATSMLVWARLNEGLLPISRAAWVMAGMIMIIPVLQLIPLPPSIWQSLPGREAEIASLHLIGADQEWMPWSIAPARTFISLLAMTSIAVVLVVAVRLDQTGRTLVCGTIAAIGLVSIVLGVLQLSHTGGFSWSLYSYYNVGVLDGFHANRNAQADTLAVSLLALGVVITHRLHRRHRAATTWFAAAATLALVPLAVIMTGSRTGMALTPIAILIFAAMLWPWVRRHIHRLWLWMTIGLIALTLIAAFLFQLPAVQHMLLRFTATREGRFDIWTDSIFALKGVWPAGGGIGSFPVLFNAAERLEVVRPTMAGRAHCDWLEWIIEAGIPGLIVLGCGIAWLAFATVKALRADLRRSAHPVQRAQTLFAFGVLVQLGLHALGDFPLRSMTLDAFAVLAATMLIQPNRKLRSNEEA